MVRRGRGVPARNVRVKNDVSFDQWFISGDTIIIQNKPFIRGPVTH